MEDLNLLFPVDVPLSTSSKDLRDLAVNILSTECLLNNLLVFLFLLFGGLFSCEKKKKGKKKS